MKVRSVGDARVDERVDAVDDELRACKTKHVLGGNLVRKKRDSSERGPHLDEGLLLLLAFTEVVEGDARRNGDNRGMALLYLLCRPT